MYNKGRVLEVWEFQFLCSIMTSLYSSSQTANVFNAPSTIQRQFSHPPHSNLNANAQEFIPIRSHYRARSDCKMEMIKEEVVLPDVLPNKCRKVIVVSRELTQNIIPNRIKEKLYNVYEYMDKSMAFRNNKRAFADFEIVVINFNFHCKNTNQVLFCAIIKAKGFGARKWRMLDQLFSAKMLKEL